MRRLPAFLILILLILPSVSAQTDEDWYLDKPISEIRFQGLQNVSAGELEGLTNPFIGKNFTNPVFWDLQSKLYALDYFESFTAEALEADEEKSKVIIEFTVVERPLLDAIEIFGNTSVRRNDLLDEIILKTGDMVNTTKVRVDEEAIRNVYLERGFPEIEVSGRIEPVDDHAVKVVFDIKEGSQTKVQTILFSGNLFAADSTLKRLMTTKEQSLFASGVYQETNIAEDIENIQKYYWERGHIDAEVVDVVRDVEQDEEGKSNLVLTFFIVEGNQYTYGGMSFEGNELYSDARIEELVRQQPGKILSRSKLEADFQLINELYASDGYIFNIITLQENRDELNREISYTVQIIERGRAHIENIIINGNEKTENFVIFRELPFEEGDIFSAKSYTEGTQNLYNLQYFASLIPDVTMGSAEGLVDVIYNVEEGRTTDINFGITFSGATTGFPGVGFVKWTDSNFLGRGQEFSVGTELSGTTQNLNFSFQENWLFGRRWSGGVDFSIDHSLVARIQQDMLLPIFSKTDPNKVPDPFDGHYVWEVDGTVYDGTAADLSGYLASGEVLTDYAYSIQLGQSIDESFLMQYDSLNFSLGARTGFTYHAPFGRLGIGTRLSTTLSYIAYDKSIYRPFDTTIRENHETLRPITKWFLNLSFDTRDIIYNPSSGIYLKESLTYTGGILPSTRHFILTATKAQGYLTLFDVPLFEAWNLKGVWAVNSALSLVLRQFVPGTGWQLAATTEDLLYIDGMTTARG